MDDLLWKLNRYITIYMCLAYWRGFWRNYSDI